MARRGSNINIEEVFVGLRRAWHPPSAAVETSFTRLTQTLAGIFRDLRADPDLAGLHREIYQDFPGLRGAFHESAAGSPESSEEVDDAKQAERLRKGFYLCNSLIQLMESVYLDLQLEQDYRHPDNRGWMNLFRHWSHSDTFRMTWAVSASTYGLRFQDFCARRLGLSLGTTDLVSIWDRQYSHLKDPPEPSPLDATGSELDTTEERLIETLSSPSVHGVENAVADRVEQVLVARLLVPSNRTAELQEIGHRALSPKECDNLLSLNFGVVVLTGSIEKGTGALLTLRVRRHLRDQGLGRKLMHDLVSRLGVRNANLPTSSEMRAVGLPGGARERVENLFKSVLNEADLGEMRRQEQRDKAEPASAVFGTVPPLPYSGVVRPPGVTWAHAVGFCYWVLVGADGISLEELEATSEALRRWVPPRVDAREIEAVADESLRWYLGAKRPPIALVPEVETIIEQVRRQPWFDDEHKKRLIQGLDHIAAADGHLTPIEAKLVRMIRDQLGPSSS